MDDLRAFAGGRRHRPRGRGGRRPHDHRRRARALPRRLVGPRGRPDDRRAARSRRGRCARPRSSGSAPGSASSTPASSTPSRPSPTASSASCSTTRSSPSRTPPARPVATASSPRSATSSPSTTTPLLRSVAPVRIRAATRGSPLARWQAEHVASLLRAVDPDVEVELVIVDTQGDRRLDVPIYELGGKGVFAKEVQAAVLDGRADLAVHSAKDLPSVTVPGLVLAAVPERGDPRDALVGSTLADLPEGAEVATGSLRRRAELLAPPAGPPDGEPPRQHADPPRQGGRARRHRRGGHRPRPPRPGRPDHRAAARRRDGAAGRARPPSRVECREDDDDLRARAGAHRARPRPAAASTPSGPSSPSWAATARSPPVPTRCSTATTSRSPRSSARPTRGTTVRATASGAGPDVGTAIAAELRDRLGG